MSKLIFKTLEFNKTLIEGVSDTYMMFTSVLPWETIQFNRPFLPIGCEVIIRYGIYNQPGLEHVMHHVCNYRIFEEGSERNCLILPKCYSIDFAQVDVDSEFWLQEGIYNVQPYLAESLLSLYHHFKDTGGENILSVAGMRFHHLVKSGT